MKWRRKLGKDLLVQLIEIVENKEIQSLIKDYTLNNNRRSLFLSIIASQKSSYWSLHLCCHHPPEDPAFSTGGWQFFECESLFIELLNNLNQKIFTFFIRSTWKFIFKMRPNKNNLRLKNGRPSGRGLKAVTTGLWEVSLFYC